MFNVAKRGDGPNSALGFCFLNLSLHSMAKNMYGERAFFGTPLSFLFLVFRSCDPFAHRGPAAPPRVKCTEEYVSSSLGDEGEARGAVRAHAVRDGVRCGPWNGNGRVPLPGLFL